MCTSRRSTIFCQCRELNWTSSAGWKASSEILRVFLDHLGASDVLRQGAIIPVNASNHNRLAAYYTPELADRVYRAYECDFDRFGYSRAIA